MNEKFLHYIWKNKLYNQSKLLTTDKEMVKIISPGEHNHNAGPDFFNSRIIIGETEWAGCVEIHIRASDWFSHQHDKNEAYNNVVLHVVGVYDVDIKDTNNRKIPTLVLPYNQKFASNYDMLIQSKKWIACEEHFASVDSMIRSMWVETLLIQRLKRKSEMIMSIMADSQNNTDEVFFRLLCRNMGFKTNAMPFEQLGRKISLRQIRTLGNNRTRIEALLMGAAGFLNKSVNDYQKTLSKEFRFLSQKFNIEPLSPSIWKFARMRPPGFPTIRLAQLSDLLSKNTQFTILLREAQELQEILPVFNASVSPFWETHYTFEKTSKQKAKSLGNKSVENIFINSVFPFLFVIGKNYDEPNLQQKVFSWMESLPAEKNRIIDNWLSIGADIQTAYDSQAYIELYNEYCQKARCLDCRLGGYIIKEI